ncbi:hypothetical protein ACFFSY_19410 [Paenibacillus aurantiacus]|uniref:Uncharacterized protein n=1 Tax=Paenibacillus aurantiacus TaxID=1936118 RepID=A0ABV5KSB2_9BACL
MMANTVTATPAKRRIALFVFTALAAVLVVLAVAALQPPAADDGVDVARRIIVYQTTSVA